MKWLTFLIAALAGVLVWALSLWLTGQREPWDAAGFYYGGALLIAGLVVGLLTPRPLWAQYLGALSGQMLYLLLTSGFDPLLAVGLLFLLAYTLIFLVGAAVAATIRRLSSRFLRQGRR